MTDSVDNPFTDFISLRISTTPDFALLRFLSRSVRKRPGSGRVEIAVPDDIEHVTHFKPDRDVIPPRGSYNDVDERDNIDDVVLDKSEDKSSDILAMRLQQKAERDRKRKKANSGVVEIRKDMKSVRGLSTESVMERIRGVQDEKDDRSL